MIRTLRRAVRRHQLESPPVAQSKINQERAALLKKHPALGHWGWRPIENLRRAAAIHLLRDTSPRA